MIQNVGCYNLLYDLEQIVNQNHLVILLRIIFTRHLSGSVASLRQLIDFVRSDTDAHSSENVPESGLFEGRIVADVPSADHTGCSNYPFLMHQHVLQAVLMMRILLKPVLNVSYLARRNLWRLVWSMIREVVFIFRSFIECRRDAEIVKVLTLHLLRLDILIPIIDSSLIFRHSFSEHPIFKILQPSLVSLPNFCISKWLSIQNKISQEPIHASTLFELATCDAHILILMVIVKGTFRVKPSVDENIEIGVLGLVLIDSQTHEIPTIFDQLSL